MAVECLQLYHFLPIFIYLIFIYPIEKKIEKKEYMFFMKKSPKYIYFRCDCFWNMTKFKVNECKNLQGNNLSQISKFPCSF